MRVFFLSEQPCALFAGGAYLGIVDGFERFTELDPKDCLFFEFVPLNGYLPVRFILDERFLLSPPPEIELYFLENAICVRAVNFLLADQSLKVLWQKRFGKTRFTLVLQGKLQLYFENGELHIIDLPPRFMHCRAEETDFGYLLSTDTAFALLSFSGELLLVSEGKILCKQGKLSAEVPLNDCLLHTAECEWEEGRLVSCKIKTPNAPAPATFALAFFESLLIGADCEPFLTEEMRERAEYLKDFLGEFLSVVLCDEPEKIGLVYLRYERVYDVRYFRVEINEEKISNIIPL